MTQQMVCPDCRRPALRPDARFCGKCDALLMPKVRSWRKLKRTGQGMLMTCGVAFVAEGGDVFDTQAGVDSEKNQTVPLTVRVRKEALALGPRQTAPPGSFTLTGTQTHQS